LPISLIRLSLYYVLKNMSEENMKDIIAVKFKNSKISNEKNKVENVFFEVKKICEENNIKNPLNLTSSNLFENFKNLTIPQKIKLMSNNVQRLKEIIFSTNQDCKIFKLDKKKNYNKNKKFKKYLYEDYEENKKNMILSDKNNNYKEKKCFIIIYYKSIIKNFSILK